jgi:formylglycine-generating enzyme required for sulfatase activity
VLSQLPTSVLSQLPTSVLSQLPTSVLSQLPASVLLQSPPRKNSIGIEFKLLPAGTFTMGDKDDAPAHRVTLTKAFELGVYGVTQKQYEKVMGSTPSDFSGPQNPVEQVSWHEAVEFCRKLSALPAEQAAGRVYRLPTEAEWEYACRGGTTTLYSFGDDESQLGQYAWYDQNSGNTTHAVGGKKPNPWGLYDMHGNVWEWCEDWYGEYAPSASEDPMGASSGSSRVLRGGSWSNLASYCRAAFRGLHVPSDRYYGVGFRVVCELS